MTTEEMATFIKRTYQRHLLEAARAGIVHAQFGAKYSIPGYTDEDVQRWYRNRVAVLRHNVMRNHRKPSKGKPLRLIPVEEED